MTSGRLSFVPLLILFFFVVTIGMQRVVGSEEEVA
jgi:hypothetical protein